MSDKNLQDVVAKTNSKKLKIYITLLIITSIVFLGGAGALGINSFNMHLRFNREIKLQKEEILKQTVFNDTTQSQLKVKDHDLEKLRKQLEGIMDKHDLLKRDIEMYIETTHPKVPSVVAKSIAINIVDLSRKHKVSPELIVGIIKVESSFNPMAVGPKTKYGHARGLMQVMPEWAKKLGLKGQYDFHQIDIAIESGIKVFLIHLDEGKGDISTGLYYYVNRDKKYVASVYAAMGKFVAFRSTIDENDQNVETDIDLNGDSKQLPTEKENKK